jgi:hypothetical protein
VKRRKFIGLHAAILPGLLLYKQLKAFSIPGATDDLQKNFQQAKGYAPYTFWQWMNGCVTKEGITYDLEAFSKVGIKDIQQFLVGGSEADITDPDVTILGEKWTELMRFALDECKRLGLTFGTHNCPGWSASGAPGLQPQDSMQKLVWTKTIINANDSVNTKLPQPAVDAKWNYYKDICVVALPEGSDITSTDSLLVLVDHLTTDNTLNQKLPAGTWQVYRFGNTTTGAINGTAPLSGQGLEVDKMSKQALEKFWALYPAKLIEMAGEHAGTTFKRIEIDSFEAGIQTWTTKMPEEFQQRRGYELLQWLPVLAGVTIESKEHSSRFMQDWQRTINELIAENYYQHLHMLIHREPGMEFLIEPYGTGHINFDTAAIRGIGDTVMCEFWWGPTSWGWDSILPVASNAHVNGKKVVAAEAFTGQPQFAWRVDLFDLKASGDKAFCNGVNRFVLHASAHQPWPHVQPGMTMGRWGTQFGPSQTWWYHGAAEWIQYVSRCQMLLQKGLFVADVCFLHLTKQKDPIVPNGYKADVCNAKELMGRFDVKENKWILPDGMSYRIIVLPDDCSIDLELAKKIDGFVKQGGVIAGNGFKGTTGLQEVAINVEVRKIGEQLFGERANGKFEKATRKIGKGKVYTGYNIQEVLSFEGIAKDVELPGEENDILWLHREYDGEHYYFVSNQANTSRHASINFRATGMQPELWNPETGVMIDARLWNQQNNRTTVELQLEAYGSVFVVFRKAIAKNGFKTLTVNNKSVNMLPYLLIKDEQSFIRLKETGIYLLTTANNKALQKKQINKPVEISLNNHWEVSFEEKRGAPLKAHFNKLISFTEHTDKGIKYFSGKAVYSKTFTLKAEQLSTNKAVFLDLGQVKNVASIVVNGDKIRTFWKPPFAEEITAFCKAGKNTLQVEVTNLWPNRMIGDEFEPDDCIWSDVKYFNYVKPPAKIGRSLQEVPGWVKNKTERPSKNRISFSTMDFFDKTDPLLPSGLLGPVKIMVEEVWNIS